MAPRNRKPDHEWLKQYPGLYLKPHGTFYVRHPITGKKASLETKDRSIAIRRWSLLAERWERERADWQTQALADKLNDLSVPQNEGANIQLNDYLAHWRRQILGHEVINGRVKWGECLVVSLRGRNRGRPVAHQTRVDYANDAHQLEQSADAAFPLSDRDITRKIRKLLAPWLQKATHYNGLRNTLSRVLAHAVQEGLIDRNPISDIIKASEQKREVLIPDEAYIAITEKLRIHRLNRREFDGTWRTKICDLIYMLSQQPIDVFDLHEDQAKLFNEPMMVDDEPTWGVVSLERNKTKVGMELGMNRELRNLWQWFIDFKKEQQIASPYLMVYPRYFDQRSRGKPVQHRFMQDSWRTACRDAGYGSEYQLRDLRKKGLTDEFLAQGENDKGGHETEAMRNHYRLIKPPKRARSTLNRIGGEGAG